MAKQLTQAIIEDWLKLVSGSFHIKDIWAEIGIEEPDNKKHLRIILYRLEEKGQVIRMNRDGLYRKADTELKPIDWQNANPDNIVPLQFPFGLEQYCRIFPRSIVIVAGSKNAGKTAFLYDFISKNMGNFIIDLFNNETSPEQMKERMDGYDIPSPSPFSTYERYDNFADVIHPDHISVIDYLDLNSEVYLVGTEIDAIFRKLHSGIAIIGLQKPPPSKVIIRGSEKWVDRDLAYGGGFTAKRAQLYITMSANRLKILYVKTPAKATVNPNNKTFTFSFNGSGRFTNIQQSFGEAVS